jgi:hypothetical protein
VDRVRTEILFFIKIKQRKIPQEDVVTAILLM